MFKGIPRSPGASSCRPSFGRAGPGCLRRFNYCSPNGEGPLKARKDFSGWNLRSYNDVLMLHFQFSTKKTPSSLGPIRLLDFEGYRAHPGEVQLPRGQTFWRRNCCPHPARNRKQTVLRSCAGPLLSFDILVLAFSLSWSVRSAKQHSRYNNSTFSEV